MEKAKVPFQLQEKHQMKHAPEMFKKGPKRPNIRVINVITGGTKEGSAVQTASVIQRIGKEEMRS